MMQHLKALLARAEKEYGPDRPGLQHLRDQIAAAETGKSAQELYLTGSVKQDT